ncbi:MAG: inner membrane protein [Methanolobus sp.]|jgi:membrane-bound metal-dependent hydrolase YbcI (DUF457 family)|nr:inner membrane protein [Methanolobus sp.]MDK2946873.1 inner membrane protein [Methanolobus sp.]
MPNFNVHFTVGIIVGIITLSILHGQNDFLSGPLSILVAIALSTVGSILPDKIEPSANPHHRSFFHSFLVLIITGLLSYHLLTGVNSANMFMIGFLGAGYVSHLVLDATTPESLPLI